MGLFNRKLEYCAICSKQLTHKHKPKKEWHVKGILCGDCHLNKMQEFYEGKVRQPCVMCKTVKQISDLWEPRWQWDMEGLLCKECFDKKEESFGKTKDYCCICEAKLGRIYHNPKPKWKIEGRMCGKCWDAKKTEMG